MKPNWIFLYCFIGLFSLWEIYHTFIAREHYDINFLPSQLSAPGNWTRVGGEFFQIRKDAVRLVTEREEIYSEPIKVGQSGASLKGPIHSPLAVYLFANATSFPAKKTYKFYVLFVLALWGIGVFFLYKNSQKVTAFQIGDYILLTSMVLLLAPFHLEMVLGSYHSFAVIASFIAYYLDRHRRDTWAAGMLLGMAILTSLYPVVFFFYLLAKSRFRTAATTLLFMMVFLSITGGLSTWAAYIQALMSHYYDIESVLKSGPVSHSTVSAFVMMFGREENRETVALIATLFHMLMILGFLVYVRISSRTSSTITDLEFAAVAILATCLPNVSATNSLVCIPFIVFPIIRGFEHPAISVFWGRIKTPVVIFVGLSCAYVVMSPIGAGESKYNIISELVPVSTLNMVRQTWFWLMGIFVLIVLLHNLIGRAKTADRSISENENKTRKRSVTQSLPADSLSNRQNAENRFSQRLWRILKAIDDTHYDSRVSYILSRTILVLIMTNIAYWAYRA